MYNTLASAPIAIVALFIAKLYRTEQRNNLNNAAQQYVACTISHDDSTLFKYKTANAQTPEVMLLFLFEYSVVQTYKNRWTCVYKYLYTATHTHV